VGSIAKTNPVRVYRGSQELTHDLNAILKLEDVNSEDIWVMLRGTQSEIIDMTPGQPMSRRLEMWVDREYDVDFGYFVEVKRARVLSGVREAIEETLSSAVVAAAVSLPVTGIVGFLSGDTLVVSDGTNSEAARVKSVGATTLTLYSDSALNRGYAAGSVVRASRFYQVVDVRVPEELGSVRVVTLMQTAGYGKVS
jgi:hypothetical protein